jgi:hypothetical protein
MKAFSRLLKFSIFLSIIIVAILYFLQDDFRRYAVRFIINQATHSGKDLTRPYILHKKKGIIVVEDLDIRSGDISINIARLDIRLPFLFFFNSQTEIKIQNAIMKYFHEGEEIAQLSLSGDLKVFSTKHINMQIIDSDLSIASKKLYNFKGDFSDISNNNLIEIRSYLDPQTVGAFDFNIKNFSELNVNSLKIPYGGGILRTESFKVDLTNPKLAIINVAVDNVNISSLITVDKFSATGKVSGNLSLDIENSKLLSLDLKSISPGSLSYDSMKLGNFLDSKKLGFLHKVLNKFEFASLIIKTEAADFGHDKDNIKISLYGLNKKLYNESPVNFNINLDIDLKSIIKSLLFVK